ncbi:sensor histidine kinase [Spirochaeta isovalerica]|uniref:histidine kinase n=1 Tax=Spirochaeta isovalerica TaxID=150 RepID=A0A841RF05_9SPIO|nr:PAS domain-containing sensor histidine kinase [Spirochaeta isovalerica]MBB6481580.1 PAS domain S-box-containing protein [Spirochaeta isovalerica]
MALIKSLRKALTLSFVLISLLPVVFFGVFSLQILNRNLQSEIEEKNLLLSRSLSREIDVFKSESMDFLKLIKDLTEENEIASESETDDLLLSMLSINKNFDMIQIISAEGRVRHLAPVDENIRMMNLSYLEIYKRTEETGEPLWSPTYISPQSGSPTVILSLPMKNGMVLGYLNLDYLSRIVEATNIAGTGFVAATDRDGTVIAHKNRQFVRERQKLVSLMPVKKGISGETGTYRYSHLDREYLGSVSRTESTGWIVLVSQPVKEAFSSIYTIINIVIFGSFLALVLSILIAYLSLKRILQPLAYLNNDSRFAAEGDYDRPFHSSKYSEINQLINSFQVMIGAVNQREMKLKELQFFLKDIINSMPSALICVDQDLNITLLNRTAEKRLSDMDDDPMGKKMGVLIPRLKGEESAIKESIEKGIPKEIRKLRRVEKSHSYFEDILVYPLVDYEAEGAVIRIDDVTEKTKMEELLIQSEKMLSIGGLAAGMAHEINNPLAGIMQTANVLNKRLIDKVDIPANKKIADELGINLDDMKTFMERREIPRMIDSMLDSGKRISSIVSNMLNFSRKSDSRKSTVSLSVLIDQTIEIAGTDYDMKKEQDFRNIRIIREFQSPMNPVVCESSKLQQVFLNLLRNGAQAMEKQTEDPQFIIRIYHDQKNNMACIEVEDNGPGMDEDIKSRIFEPFFTTKPPGIGTGLGLSVSYFIIHEEHRGQMNVESAPGKGSRFIIHLPYSP